MFILKRQDVEIYSVRHPKKDQQVPILQYHGQTFRLISVFGAAQEEEARAFWRDLTDNRGKACVLLEEPERYSIWGKIRLEEAVEPASSQTTGQATGEAPACCVQAGLLLLQAVYLEVEDLLGNRQASTFRKELADLFQKNQFPQANQPDLIDQLLSVDPLALLQVPSWRDLQLSLLLQELHRLGKQQFGNVNFVQRAMEALGEMSSKDRSLFLSWLKRSQAGKQWS